VRTSPESEANDTDPEHLQERRSTLLEDGFARGSGPKRSTSSRCGLSRTIQPHKTLLLVMFFSQARVCVSPSSEWSTSVQHAAVGRKAGRSGDEAPRWWSRLPRGGACAGQDTRRNRSSVRRVRPNHPPTSEEPGVRCPRVPRFARRQASATVPNWTAWYPRRLPGWATRSMIPTHGSDCRRSGSPKRRRSSSRDARARGPAPRARARNGVRPHTRHADHVRVRAI